MKQTETPRKQYWVLLIVFSLCALAGVASIVVAELFMPNNAGGQLGRQAMFRSMGAGTVAWTCIAVWAGYKLRVSRLSNGK